MCRYISLLVLTIFLLVLNTTPASAGYANAKYHGKVKGLCPKSTIFDPRKGGECWSCPEGTHRTVLPVTPVTAPNACQAIRWAKAKDLGKVKTGKPSGAFKDPRKGGEWWRCPKNRPRRTAYPVTHSRACATKWIIGEKLAHANYLGKVNRPKPKGAFRDLRRGGEYWRCPPGFKRTVLPITPVTASNACTRATTDRASFRTRANYSVGCPGTIFDPRKGGECWSCPAKWYRTTRPVYGGQACTNSFAEIIVDPKAMCRKLISDFAKGTKAMDDIQKTVDKITAPLMAPVNAIMKKMPKVNSPKEFTNMMEKVGAMIEPYTAGLDELQRMSVNIRKNKARIRKILLNPSLMCSGNGRKVIQALRSAGVNPKRQAGLFDGLLIKSAHAAMAGRFFAFSITNEGRTLNQLLGITVGFTLVTDFSLNTRLFFSYGPYTSTAPGFSGSFDFMWFPRTTINDFDMIQQLGVEFSFSAGNTIQDAIEKWPKRARTVIGKLPGGLNISLQPDFSQIPGFGTTIASGNENDGKGRFQMGLVDMSLSVDLSVQLVRFK